MKRLLLGFLGYFALTFGAASQQAPVFNWSGFYFGVGAGGTYAPVDRQYYNSPGAANFVQVRTASPLYSGHVGWNFRSGNWVYGLEANLSGPTTTERRCDAPAFCANFDAFQRFSNIGTVGPRIGMVVNDRWMPYVSAGWAISRIESGFIQRSNGVVTRGVSDHNGWFVGLGVEYAWSKNVVLGLEYQHLDFETSLANPAGFPVTNVSHYNSPTADLLRFKISFQ